MARTKRKKAHNYYKHESGPARKITRQADRAKRNQEIKNLKAGNLNPEDHVFHEDTKTEGWVSW